jgi:alkylation response protein AidB-like acyl-CoA dehydrogenase
MNFEFTDDQKMIRDTAREYSRRELFKDVTERDSGAIYPSEHIKNISELGFFGMLIDPIYGGYGFDNISYVLALEEISKVDSSVAVILSVHNSLVAHGIETFGSPEQKSGFLPVMASGEKIGAFLLSEPDAGSDAASIKTIAAEKGDHFLINGVKNWITSANSGGIYLLFAQSHPEKGHNGINAFLVDRHSKGITLGPHENKMGMRSSDTHSVMFSDVVVPKGNRIGEEGAGYKIALKLLEGGRIGIASQALGIAEGAYELSVKYAKQRRTFGTEIINHQVIGFKLADMASQIEAARLLVYKAAWLKDNHLPYGTASAMAKLFASDTAMKVTTEAVQIHGGYGYVKEYHVERLMREAKLTQIYEGTSEIQKLVISRSISRES